MATIDYNNLDFLLNIYYDFIYRKTPDKSYIFNPIYKKKLQLINLKMPNDYDSSEIFNKKFKYLGYYNNKFNFKIKNNIPCQSCPFRKTM